MDQPISTTPAADYFNRRENDKKPLIPRPVTYVLAAVVAVLYTAVISLTIWAVVQSNERIECFKAKPVADCPAPTPLERAVYSFWQIG